MKAVSLFAILLFLASCASSRLDRKIEDHTWDSLADESYLRWGEKRLDQFASKDQDVIGCYKGNVKETLQKYKRDFLTKNQTSYYWLHVGNCYFIEEVWSKAEFFYRMALDESKLTTVKSIALNNLGLIHFKYEQWEKGKDFLKQSMAMAPNFKVPKYNMSQLYLQFGLYDRAIELLNDSAFRGHKDIDVFFSLANAHLYKGDLKTSAEYFRLIPKDQFRREDIAATYALFLIKSGKYQEAKEVMKERSRSEVPEITAISHKIEKILIQRMKEE